MTDLRAVRPPFLLLLLLVGAVGFAFVPMIFRAPTPPLVGRAAPDLSIPIASPPGAKPFVLREHRGHVVVIVLFTTWSDVTNEQHKIVADVSAKYDPARVAFLGVVTSDERKGLGAWLEKHPVAFPIAFDDDDRVAHALDVNNTPSFVIVSPSGVVASVTSSGLDAPELTALIDRAR